VTRQCSRPGCSELATATLTYVHGAATAWLDRLADDRDPHAYDLCERHAGRIGVPRGWQLVDRRHSALALTDRLAG
jgi:hypothetical protein